MAEDAKWYVVHTYSGYENAVAAAVMKAAENRRMTDLIREVNIPMETVTEITDGKEKTVERKVFPRTRTHGDEGGESMNLKRLSLKLLGGAGGFFAVTFLIYFFNLDMKFLSSCVEPILLRHYDRIPRKHYI